MITAQKLHSLCSNATPAAVEAIVDGFNSASDRYGVATARRMAHFFGQTAHETQGFTRFEENLNYSPVRLAQVWPRLANRADELARNPRSLANAAYADRLGNGKEASGDGFRYRGRGPIQITGKANYQQMADKTGLYLVDMPDAVADPKTGIIVALAWWNANGCNEAADTGSVEAVTRIVNGPSLAGLDDRKKLTQLARMIFL